MKIKHLNWLSNHKISFELGMKYGFETIKIPYTQRAEAIKHFYKSKEIRDIEYIGTKEVILTFEKGAKL